MKIAILGCGWLGLPLAKHLISKNHVVKGSTTSKEKLADLEKVGIQPFEIILASDVIIGAIESFLSEATVLVVAIPPGLRKNPDSDFVSKMGKLISFVEKSAVENVLLVSSTSVFEDDNQTISATTIPNGKSENAQQLIAVEALFQKNNHFKTTVLRFGGLINEDRHPIRFLAGRTEIVNPEAPINLIHLEDCIEIMTQILEKQFWNQSLNAVGNEHPTRKAYYTEMARLNDLPLPEFTDNEASFGKHFESGFLEKELDYMFKQKIAPYKIKK
uniref:NAD(P)H-binding protein n=1 Tax=Flavobacterium sp. TaxID=239 RepID=UPI00404B9A74